MIDYRKSLETYLEGRTKLSVFGIVEMLKDCPIDEFDRIVKELRPVHGQYVSWPDVPEIRHRLKVRMLKYQISGAQVSPQSKSKH
jgi:hypothetical protein